MRANATSQTFRFVGVAALSVATAGVGPTLIGFGAGSVFGAVDTALGGGSPGDVAIGALHGGEFGMGLTAIGGLLPKAAVAWGGLGLNVGMTSYGVYDSFSQGNTAQGIFRLGTGVFGAALQVSSLVSAPQVSQLPTSYFR